MQLRFVHIASAASVAFAAGVATAQPVFRPLGDSPLSPSSGSMSVSRNGQAIVSSVSNQPLSIHWTSGGGGQPIVPLPGDDRAGAVRLSNDGSVWVGASYLSTGPQPLVSRPVRWTAAGPQNLGSLPGLEWEHASIVSGDGGVVMGTAQHMGESLSPAVYFRWTSGSGLQAFTGPSWTAYGFHPGLMNGTGSVVVGSYASTPQSQFGGMDDSVFVWTGSASSSNSAAGTFSSLPRGPEPANARITANAVNDAGTVIVGRDGNSAALWRRATLASAWTVQTLTVPAAYADFTPTAVDESGTIIGGSIYHFPSTWDAILWTPATGAMNLNFVLPQIGIDLQGLRLDVVTGIQFQSGMVTLSGEGSYADGMRRSWSLSGLDPALLPAPSSMGLLCCGALVGLRRRR